MTWSVHHGHALAYQECGEPLRARVHAHLARRSATTAAQAAETALVMAWVSQQLGDHDTAVTLLDEARPTLSDRLLARADCLHGLTLCMKSEHEPALAILTSAARRLDDGHWRANALVGVGVSAGYLRREALAADALDRAHDLYLAHGRPERAATCLHNKGFVAAQAGDFARALELYDAAAVDETKHPEVLVDRAHALLGAGLLGEAGRVLARAAALLGAAGRGPAFAEATLAHAQRALRAGDLDTAARAATSAGELFHAQRRPGWAAHARSIRLRAAGETSTEVADACERAGWLSEAAELRLAAGRTDLVEPHRFSDTAELHTLGWLARARTARTRQAAFAACHAGGLADRRLTAIGLDTAFAGGRTRTIFTWVERSRGLPAPRHRDIVAAIGDRALLDLFVHKGHLSAISVVCGRFRRHCLGPASAFAEAAEALRTSSALAARTASPTSAEPAATVLDAMLFGELGKVVGDRELIVLPSAEFSSVPWAALPSLAGRPLSVAPSALAWLNATRVGPPTGPPAWIACPGLDHAAREASDLHGRHGGTLVVGAAATVAATLAAMSGAGLAHIAAHGRHRASAPQFSALAMADGPLHAYDVGRLPEPPRRLVLSSCESAKADLLGLTAVLLGFGVGTVIASTLPVPDELAVGLMTGLHERLAAGVSPARALAEAQREHGHLGFACYGSPG